MADHQRDADLASLITFIHAPDSQHWVRFLQSKLLSDHYSIRSTSQCPPLPADFFSSLPSSPSSPSHGLLCALIVSPDLLEPAYSTFWASYVETHRGPSVVILLGVVKEDLMEVLGTSTSARVLAQPWVEVKDRDSSTVSQALISLIEMFESAERTRPVEGLAQGSLEVEEDDDELEEEEEDGVEKEEGEEEEERGGVDQEEDEEKERFARATNEEMKEEGIYQYPPPPRQQNNIVKVIPTVLYETPGEVVVVMKREAEEPLTMVVETNEGPSRHLDLQHLASSAYVATIPKNIQGRISFLITCKGHILGGSSLHIRSRLDQLHALLEREVNPVTLLCKAAGVAEVTSSTTDSDSKMEELDGVLSRRLSLSQLPPGLLGVLCPDDMATPASDHEAEYFSQSQWPTLLHFAADFNLVRTCEALLKYPDMVHAACTENAKGFFPCMLAERRGFKALHTRLVQYVEQMSAHAGQHKRAADSGICIPETLPPPKRHGSHGPSYVNDVMCSADPGGSLISDEDFMEKGRMYAFNKQRSFSEGSVRTPYARPPSEDRIAEEEDGDDTTPAPPPALKPKLSRATSAIHHRSSPPTSSRRGPPLPLRSMSSTSGSSEHHQISHPYATLSSALKRSTPTSFPGEDATAHDRTRENLDDVTSEMTSCRIGSHGDKKWTSLDSIASLQQTPPEEETTTLRYKTKRSKSLQDKISNFFSKIKPARRHRSSSDTNLVLLGRGQKKTTVYVRQSTSSTRSDPTSYCSTGLWSNFASARREEYERDSGAVCEETTETQRRMSVRVQRAKNEDLGETPSLPPRSSKAAFALGGGPSDQN